MLKIGHSINPDNRLKSLRLLGIPIRVLASTQCSDLGKARQVERLAHRLLAAKRFSGEWFDVTLAEATTAIEKAAGLVECGDSAALAEDIVLCPHAVRLGVISIMQCRVARAALRWDVGELAAAAGVSPATVACFVRGGTNIRRRTVEAIRRAFEDAGVEFLDGNGVLFRPVPESSP